MIVTTDDVKVWTRADFERLPEGLWEVVNGSAILLPAPELRHQKISGALFLEISRALKALGRGHVVCTVNVLIPVPLHAIGEVQNRLPDLVIYLQRTSGKFEVGHPPEIVIEILSTPRGNVERTEKLDDYARAGIPEYWVMSPFDRAVEQYLLENGDYRLAATAKETLRAIAVPGLEIDLREVWRVLD
jgi:Uma2 family endonuclease